MSHRTAPERRVDALAAEARKLRAIPQRSPRQQARLREIEVEKLPAAWNLVYDLRAGRR